LCDNPNHIYLAADGATWHKGPENTKLREECGYLQLPWPPNSLDLNPIENLWLLLKRRLRKLFSEKEHCPHSAHELFVAAQEEWEEIDQGTIDDLIDSMPRRIQAVIEADGGHTKW
jgi:transposase